MAVKSFIVQSPERIKSFVKMSPGSRCEGPSTGLVRGSIRFPSGTAPVPGTGGGWSVEVATEKSERFRPPGKGLNWVSNTLAYSQNGLAYRPGSAFRKTFTHQFDLAKPHFISKFGTILVYYLICQTGYLIVLLKILSKQYLLYFIMPSRDTEPIL